MGLINLTNVSYKKRVINADISLSSNQLVGVIGANGAGKSTLLKLIAGIINPDSGILNIDNKAISLWPKKQLAKKLAWVPQSAEAQWPISVKDAISLGAMHQSFPDKAVDEAIKYCRLETFSNKFVNELSGGERARVWLARALAATPDILLTDEPIAALDLKYQVEVMSLLQHYAQSGHLVMTVLHDISLAARFCEKIILMDKGKIVAIGPPESVLTEELLVAAYQTPVAINLTNNPPFILPR